jgi:GxxExxY protein
MTAQTKLIEKELTQEIIGAFYMVYNELGYGFLESVYSNALSLELRLRNLRVQREVAVEVLYLGQPVGLYRMDQVVENRVLIEIKSSAAIAESDRRQLFNYLKACPLQVGLLFHFGPQPVFERFVSPNALNSQS